MNVLLYLSVETLIGARRGIFVEIERGTVVDAGGHPHPDIVVDLWLGPLVLVLFGTKFFLYLVLNSRVFSKFLIIKVSFCKHVLNKVSITFCSLC